LEAVTVERVRRSLAAVEVAPPEVEVRDEELGRLVEAVAPFARGKRVIMLGGKNRPQVAQELGGLLECVVTWLDSDRGDKFSRTSPRTRFSMAARTRWRRGTSTSS